LSAAGKTRILFVGHEASRTGAPIALLHLVRWLKVHASIDASFLLWRGGPIVNEFAELFPTEVLTESRWLPHSRKRRILRRLGLNKLGHLIHEKYVLRNQVLRPDLIYCNSLASEPAMEVATKLGGRVLLHMHELEFSFRAGVGPKASARALAATDRFIACAQAVADNLVQAHGIPADRIDVVHGFIPFCDGGDGSTSNKPGWLREQLGLAPGTFLVGGSGQGGWRKGADLFVQLAAVLQKSHPDLSVHFVWLGGDVDSSDTHQFRHDIELSGMTRRITHIVTQPDPKRYFRELDLFVLPSREDPYPLVCLEAAACGVPIVCFDRAGGMPEFVEGDSGIIVPYLDVCAMANAVVELLGDDVRRQRLGGAAKTKVRARHDISMAGPKVLAAIHRAIQVNHPDPG
jgi:glycosyltransferase involved in cell wall biosynthesis